MSSTSEMPPAIHGCPVFVVDCTSNLQFEKPSKECDAVINQIVDFLLSTLNQTTAEILMVWLCVDKNNSEGKFSGKKEGHLCMACWKIWILLDFTIWKNML